MASQKRTDNFNTYHRSLSQSGAPQPYLPEPLNGNNDNSARVPEQHPAQHGHGVNWEVIHDEAPARPASPRDSLLQELDHCVASGLPNHIIYLGDKRNHDENLVECDTIFTEFASWGQTSDVPSALGAEVTVSAGLVGNGFQYTVDTLQMPVSTNPGEDFQSYLHGLFEIEGRDGAVEENESANLFTRNTAPFEQSPTDFFLADKSSSYAAPLNGGFESSIPILSS
jgi:hypothetical protein